MRFKSVPEIRKEIKNTFSQNPSLTELLLLQKIETPILSFKKLERFIEQNVRGITSTQIRKLADLVKGKPSPNMINIARPQFALMIAKSKREEAKKIMLLVDELAGLAAYDPDEKLHEGFPFFVQTLIAFHRYYDSVPVKRMKSGELEREVQFELFGKNPMMKIENLLDPSMIAENLDSLERFLDKNSKGITATQLRNIYDDLNSKDLTEIKRSIPVLFYTAARQSRKESIKFIFLITELIKVAKEERDLKRILEAIVSIHKYKETIAYKKIKTGFEAHFGRDLLPVLLKMNSAFGDFDAAQEKIKSFVLNNGSGLKSSQFHRLLKPAQEAKSVEELVWLRPLLLYTAARQNNSKARNIILLLVSLIKQVKSNEQVQGFKILMEDMIAYHRYFDSIGSAIKA